MSWAWRRRHAATGRQLRRRAAIGLATVLTVTSAATITSPGASAAGPTTIASPHSTGASAQTLTVKRVGHGKITSSPTGIKCGARCIASFADSTVVTLTVHARAGWTFTGWSGDCTGAGGCQVVMTGAKSVVATFTSTPHGPHTLTTEICEDCLGTITSNPVGINCPADCTQDYADGTIVTLTETPAVGWSFTQWAGACNDSSPTCTVTMDDAKFVRAFFLQDIYRLDVAVDGVIGAGRVTSDPGNIRCPEFDCWWTYFSGTVVHLTPIAQGGFKFYGWSGACTGTGSCDIAMNGTRTATADFDCQPVRCKVADADHSATAPGSVRPEVAKLG